MNNFTLSTSICLRLIYYIFFPVFLSLVLWRCSHTSENSQEEYPIRFKYQQLDFKPSKFYVLTSNSFNEIGAAGNYVTYDDFLKNELDISNWGFEIEQLELLDESNIKIYFFDYLGITPSDTTLNYIRDGNQISFGFNLSANDPIIYTIDSGNSAARITIKSVEYSYHLSSSNVDYSPVDASFHGQEDLNALISQLRQEWNLQPGDTVAINFSDYLYPKSN